MKAIFLTATLILLTSCTMTPSANLQTVPHVDLDRYARRWYVIAHVPYFLEKGKVATADTYARRPDGRLDAIYTFRKDLDAEEKAWRGVATVTNEVTNAEWKVSFIWPISSTYLVLELDPEYRWAVVSSGGGKLVWVLGREPSLADEVYQDILQRLAARGLEPTRLVKVLQKSG